MRPSRLTSRIRVRPENVRTDQRTVIRLNEQSSIRSSVYRTGSKYELKPVRSTTSAHCGGYIKSESRSIEASLSSCSGGRWLTYFLRSRAEVPATSKSESAALS
jgi:hypothetical protein